MAPSNENNNKLQGICKERKFEGNCWLACPHHAERQVDTPSILHHKLKNNIEVVRVPCEESMNSRTGK